MAVTQEGTTSPAPGYIGQAQIDYKAYYTKVLAAVEEYNAMRDYDFVSKVVEETTELKIKHWQRSIDMTRIPEYWTPDRQKLNFFTVDIPLLNYGAGIGMSLFAWQDATQGEADKLMSEAFLADQRNRAKIAYYIMTRNSADAAGGATSASGFWNSTTSGLTPPPFKNTSFNASHDHYIALGAGVTEPRLSDLNAMETQITHHGYSEDGNGLWMICNQATVELIKNLASFTQLMTPVPFVSQISGEGFRSGVQLSGFELYRDNWMSDNYMLPLSVQRPIIAQRIPQNAIGQGLQYIKGNNSDIPVLGSYFVRRAGSIVQEKGAGAVYLLAADTYTAPTYSFEYVA